MGYSRVRYVLVIDHVLVVYRLFLGYVVVIDLFIFGYVLVMYGLLVMHLLCVGCVLMFVWRIGYWLYVIDLL